MTSRLNLLFAALVAVVLSGCSGGGYDRVGSSSRVTGESYGDEYGYQPREYNELPAAPGMVFIEGGTFHMGGSEKDIAYDMDNRERQVTVASYYIDEMEIANVDWKEFLHFMLQDSGDAKYEAMMPDTLCWFRELAYNDPYVLYYFQHEAFDMYPVVGVDWYQCQEFAVWRTGIVNGKLLERDPEANTFPRYRLPTEAEWEYAARGLLEQELYPWEGKSLRNTEGRFRANFKRGRGDYAGRSNQAGSNLIEGLNDAFMIPAPVSGPFAPNDFGLMHMAGNVAEWTEDTYRVLAYEDVDDLNPYRRRGGVQDWWNEDIDYRDRNLSLLYNPTPNGYLYGGDLGAAGQMYGVEIGAHDRVKVYRGGSWQDIAYYLSCGTRRFYNADSSSSTIGFRCAMTKLGLPY
jgi:gliding motility-associated lipoprotein GldJ